MNEPDPDDTFRCEKYACVLAEKHCLRRQHETKHVPRAKGPVPAFEHCFSGECQQGNAIAGKYPGRRFQRPVTRSAPRLDIIEAVEERIAKGEVMPRGKRSEPWPCCGSNSHRHLKTCSTAAKASTRPTPERLSRIVKAAAKVRRETPAQAAGLTDMSIEELVELGANVQDELSEREKALRLQLQTLEKVRAA